MSNPLSPIETEKYVRDLVRRAQEPHEHDLSMLSMPNLGMTRAEAIKHKRETLGHFEPDPLADAAWEYHMKTEEYDQLICSNRRGNIAVPVTGQERTLSSEHARTVLVQIAKREGVSTLKLHESIRRRSGEFEYYWQRRDPSELRCLPQPDPAK